MALKLLKVLVTLEVKADRSDPEDVKERVYDHIQMLIESDDLEYALDEEEEEIEDES